VVWFTDSRLAGAPFGVNGIRTDKNNKMVYVSVTLRVPDFQGVIYRLPLVATPTAADLQEFAAVHAGRCPTLQSSRPRARIRSLAAAHRDVRFQNESRD